MEQERGDSINTIDGGKTQDYLDYDRQVGMYPKEMIDESKEQGISRSPDGLRVKGGLRSAREYPAVYKILR
jgi:hypothetical protein